MMLRCALLVSGLAAPLVACPVAADLGTGIRIDFAEAVMTFRRTEPDVIAMQITYDDDGRVYDYDRLHGVLTLRSVLSRPIIDSKAAGQVTVYDTRYTYRGLDLATPLAPGLDIAVEVEERDVSEAVGEVIGYTLRFDAGGPIMIGKCRYDSLRMTHSYQRGDEVFAANSQYLPALGIAFISDNSVDGSFNEAFTPRAIRVLE